MLIFQKSICNNVLISSVLVHYTAILMLVFRIGKYIAVFKDISRIEELPILVKNHVTQHCSICNTNSFFTCMSSL